MPAPKHIKLSGVVVVGAAAKVEAWLLIRATPGLLESDFFPALAAYAVQAFIAGLFAGVGKLLTSFHFRR